MSEYKLEIRSPYNILSNPQGEGKLNSFEITVKQEESVQHLEDKIKLLLTEEYNPNTIRLIYFGRVLSKEDKFCNLFEKLTNFTTPIVFHLVVGYKTPKTLPTSKNSTNLSTSSTSHNNASTSQPVPQTQPLSQQPPSAPQPINTPNANEHTTDYLYFNIVKHQDQLYLSPIRSHLSSIDGVQGILSPLTPVVNTPNNQPNTEQAPPQPPHQQLGNLILNNIRRLPGMNDFRPNGERLFMGVWALIQSFFLSSILTSAFNINDEFYAHIAGLGIFALLMGLRMNAFSGYFNVCSQFIQNYLPDLSEAPTSPIGTVLRFVYLFFATLIPDRAAAGGNDNNNFDGF